MPRNSVHHSRSPLSWVFIVTWWCGGCMWLTVTIIHHKNVLPSNTIWTAKLSLPTRDWKSCFVIDRFVVVSRNKNRSTESFHSGNVSCLLTGNCWQVPTALSQLICNPSSPNSWVSSSYACWHSALVLTITKKAKTNPAVPSFTGLLVLIYKIFPGFLPPQMEAYSLTDMWECCHAEFFSLFGTNQFKITQIIKRCFICEKFPSLMYLLVLFLIF